MNPQLWWYVSRASGILAWALLSLSVCWGLFLSTKALAKATAPAWTLDLHRFLGGVSVLATVAHLGGLVADNYVHFGLAELLVPMRSTWRPLAVASGVVSLYLLVAVEATSLLMKRLPRRWWRGVHRTSFGLWLLATVHMLQAGADVDNTLLRVAVLAATNIIAFLTVVVVLASHRRASPRSRPAPDPSPAAA